MKQFLLFAAILLCAGIASAQAPVITPSTPPSVQASGTVTINCTSNCGSIVYTCPSCLGTLSGATGTQVTYTAPATIHSCQSFGGYQLFDCSHIYNTRIDSLSVNSNSAAWIAAAGTVAFSYQFSFPSNYLTSSTPAYTLAFDDTPGNNGNFQILSLFPYPWLRQETGVFAGACCDRHQVGIRTDTGTVSELYDTYGVNHAFGPNATSGIAYSNSTYNLPNTQGGSTDAGGLYLAPLELKEQELAQAIATSGTIKHALRMTLQGGFISSSFIWPATANAIEPGTVPYGARFRLKSTYTCAGCTAAQNILLTQLKQYGLILADGGTGWASPIEYDNFVTGGASGAIFGVNNLAIAPSNFEAVDESGLEAYGGSSGATSSTEHVVATASGGATTELIVLTGVTVNLPKNSVSIQAGAPAITLSAYVQGSANTAVTWAMSPTVGSIDSSTGVYTPPATASAVTNTTITATSSADSSVAASMFLQVAPNLPDGVIRMVGACCGSGADYTDTNGHVWYHGAYALDGIANTGSGSWPMTPNITLYESDYDSFGNDLRFDIYVPNGTYTVDGKFADAQCVGPGARAIDIETQGTVNYSNLDINVAAGGCYLPIDFTTTAVVTNNLLSYVIRWFGNSSNVPSINAVSFTQTNITGSNISGGVIFSSGTKIQ